MKKSDYEKTSEALFIWFTQFRDKGVPISGPILKEKALHFQKEFNEGDTEFTASIAWLDRWKKRYGIRQLNTRRVFKVSTVFKLRRHSTAVAV